MNEFFPNWTLRPFYPPMHGVPGSSQRKGIRQVAGATVYYVDADHPKASDDNKGWSPEYPFATIQHAVDTVVSGDWIVVMSIDSDGESVVTPDYTEGANYVRLVGIPNASKYAPAWESDNAAASCLDLRGIGWHISGFRFYAPTGAACIELRHTDSGANDIAIRTEIEGNYFDGLTEGLYGIESHGCYDVWIHDNWFSLFHNAGGTATALVTTTTPLAIPYRNHIYNNYFMDSDNHVEFAMNGSRFGPGNFVQTTGYAYAATNVVVTNPAANPGDDNMVAGNYFEGDYSIAGGFRPGAADFWTGNYSDDTAEAEVGDNGITIARPT